MASMMRGRGLPVDFRRIDQDPAERDFIAEVRSFLAEALTPELRARIHDSGYQHDDGFQEALGRRGWILPERPPAEGGAGLSRLRAEILDLELLHAQAPVNAMLTTRLVLPAIEQHGAPDLAAELAPQVASGHVRFCLGYTEPDSGSDIAAAKTSAVRDGDGWVINGSKMFTTEAPNCQYCFLLTRTDPKGRKHQSLTMFLVPLESDGVEISAMRTLGNETTSAVYYTDVRLDDRYRIGGENEGWRVLLGPLEAEHTGSASEVAPLSHQAGIALAPLRRSLDTAIRWAAQAPSDSRDEFDPYPTLAWIATELEAASCLNDPEGRVYGSDACIRGCAEIARLVGPAAALRRSAPEAVEEGALEEAFRFAHGTAIYGGTVEIFRNLIAQHVLGLPRPLPR